MREEEIKQINSLCNQMLELVNKSDVPVLGALKAAKQCALHIRNRLEVEWIIEDSGLQSFIFKGDNNQNDNEELSFRLERDHRDIGFISKRWDEPFLRISDYVSMDKELETIPGFHQEVYAPYCSPKGIEVELHDLGNLIEDYYVEFYSDIYVERLNKDTMIKTVGALAECVEKAREFYERSSKTCN